MLLQPSDVVERQSQGTGGDEEQLRPCVKQVPLPVPQSLGRRTETVDRLESA